MNDRQTERFNIITRGTNAVTAAQVYNGIEQVLSGTWTTGRLKACQAWARLTEDQKQRLSKLVDRWLYEKDGGKGCITENGMRPYYKPDYREASVIMPAKLVL